MREPFAHTLSQHFVLPVCLIIFIYGPKSYITVVSFVFLSPSVYIHANIKQKHTVCVCERERERETEREIQRETEREHRTREVWRPGLEVVPHLFHLHLLGQNSVAKPH